MYVVKSSSKEQGLFDTLQPPASSLKPQASRKCIYKTVDEYDEDLYQISKQINDKIYEDIIKDLKMAYREYIFDGKKVYQIAVI